MKHFILLFFCLSVLLNISCNSTTEKIDDTKVSWLSLDEAMNKFDKKEKPIFIDFYTDWCKWCKVMDGNTFVNPEVIKYMNNNFYSVKFNAEQKQTVSFNGKEYKFMPAGRRGVHGLAYELLSQRPAYPAFVTLNKDLKPIGTIRGFKKADQFLASLQSQLN